MLCAFSFVFCALCFMLFAFCFLLCALSMCVVLLVLCALYLVLHDSSFLLFHCGLCVTWYALCSVRSAFFFVLCTCVLYAPCFLCALCFVVNIAPLSSPTRCSPRRVAPTKASDPSARSMTACAKRNRTTGEGRVFLGFSSFSQVIVPFQS